MKFKLPMGHLHEWALRSPRIRLHNFFCLHTPQVYSHLPPGSQCEQNGPVAKAMAGQAEKRVVESPASGFGHICVQYRNLPVGGLLANTLISLNSCLHWRNGDMNDDTSSGSCFEVYAE